MGFINKFFGEKDKKEHALREENRVLSEKNKDLVNEVLRFWERNRKLEDENLRLREKNQKLISDPLFLYKNGIWMEEKKIKEELINEKIKEFYSIPLRKKKTSFKVTEAIKEMIKI